MTARTRRRWHPEEKLLLFVKNNIDSTDNT